MNLLSELLKRKNLIFKNFHGACGSFLDEIAKGNTSGIERFQTRRQSLLHVASQIDQEIDTLIIQLKTNGAGYETLMTTENRALINQHLREKDNTIQSILELDKEILRNIGEIKKNTIQKLQSVQVGRKTLGAYKSPMETLDNLVIKKVDKEA